MAWSYASEPDITPQHTARAADRERQGGARWIVAVAVCFTLCQFFFVPVHLSLGFDETVYVSQVGTKGPAAFFSAPRARGVSYLAVPVVAFTSSTVALRCYLALLSGAGLLGALWVWRPLRPGPVPAVAGLLFAGLWITQFYGPQVMPNLWVAEASLACAGFFLRAGLPRRAGARSGTGRWAPAGIALTLGAVVQLRPPDGFWLALPLTLAALTVAAWRRAAVFWALAAGAVLGGTQWLVESYTRYGGVAARFAASDRVEGGLGLHLAFGDQLRSLGGRTLCRPCTGDWAGPAEIAWWFALPVFVACGLFLAHRARTLGPDLLTALCGVSMALPYLLLITYAAPRFLLPSYALLSLPAARCVVWSATGAGRTGPHRLTTGLTLVALTAHLAVQHVVLAHTVARTTAAHAGFTGVARELHALGVRPPCLVTGSNAIPIGYETGCASAATGGNNASTTPARITATARRRPVAVLVPAGHGAPAYAATWQRHPLPASRPIGPYLAYVSPDRHRQQGRPSASTSRSTSGPASASASD